MQVGGTLTASAAHAAGQDDTVTLLGTWGSGAHKVTVSFVNDAYGGAGGSALMDRNLYLDGVTFNGTAVAGGAVGSVTGTSPATISFGQATDTAPAVLFGTPGSWGINASVAEGHTTYGGQDYHSFHATTAWGGVPAAQSIPATWAASNASHLAFDNIPTLRLDFHAAGTAALDLMLVAAKGGSVTADAGNNTITWVAESDAAGSGNVMVINTGNGSDTVHVTAVGASALAAGDAANNGSAYNPGYMGNWSTADVRLGAGADIVTTDASVRLVLHGGSGFATASGGNASDTFYVGKGGGDFTGGAGNDWYVLQRGQWPCDGGGFRQPP